MVRVGVAIVALAAAALVTGCTRSSQNEPPENGRTVEGSDWLRGDVDTRFGLVGKHLRGFDMAMVEVGYRYTELYWATRDRNWEYAAYQLGKIETAVANGVERRPARAVSAQMLGRSVEGVRMAIESQDTSALDAAIETLTATCNTCHQAERVPYIHVVRPEVRDSPVRGDTVRQPERGR